MITSENLDKVIEHIGKRAANVIYFFSKLNTPDWIEPLTSKGLFKSPPPTKKNSNNQIVGSSDWPQSQYLARMASKDPQKVIDVALTIETDNFFIIADLTDAATRMPIDLSLQWTAKLIKWLSIDDHKIAGGLERIIAQLAIHIAREGKSRRAIELLKAILSLAPDDDELADCSFLHPKIRFQQYSYKEILEAVIPVVATASPLATIKLLSDLLDKAIVFSIANPSQSKPHDLSAAWRPAIEDHEQNHDYGSDVKIPLVTALRNTCESFIKRNPDKTNEVLEILAAYQWDIFRRLALHLLKTATDMSIVQGQLVNLNNLHNGSIRHEYLHLLKAQFKNLPMKGKEQICNWIEQGPEKEKDENIDTDEKLERYRRYWKLKILSMFVEDAPVDLKQLYQNWINEFGEPEHPDFSCYSTGVRAVIPKAPISEDDLMFMSPDEVINYLARWTPPQNKTSAWDTPSIEGMGNSLKIYIEKHSDKFLNNLDSVKARIIEPTYITSIISGYYDVYKSTGRIDWQKILLFCKWAISKDRPIPEGRNDFFDDAQPDWDWTRRTVIDLIEKALNQELDIENTAHTLNLIMPESLVWEILINLAHDENPTPEIEAAESAFDSHHRAINSTRGKAIHTIILYAMLRKKQLGPAFVGLSSIPQAKFLLEEKLIPRNDISPAVRSSFGFHIATLYHLDKDWTCSHLLSIFPENDPQLRQAAWETYVTYQNPTNDIYPLLKSLYAQAVNELTDIKSEDHKSYLHRLAEHLFIIYANERTILPPPQEPIGVLFTKASDELRKHTIGQIAISLCDVSTMPDGNAGPIIERFKALWDWRMHVISTESDKAMFAQELSAFSHWFGSAAFDDEWCLGHLINTLEWIGKNDQVDHWQYRDVIEHLIDVILKRSDLADKAFTCFDLIIKHSTEPWIFSAEDAEIRKFFALALNHDNPVIVEKAKELINLLLAKGHFGFKTILDEIPQM